MTVRSAKQGWREPVVLAGGLWALNFLAHAALNAWLGLHPFLLLLAAAWSLHGFALTWPLHLAVLGGRRLPAVVRWTAIGAVTIALTFVQVRLDVIVSRLIGSFAPDDVGPVGFMLLNRTEPLRNVGPDISMMIYFWVFGAYAIGANLLLAQRRLFNTERRAQAAELEALRLQLNPHFLFNALNSVSSLIVTGRHAEAEQTTQSLAEFLQGAMTVGGGLVRLEDELATLEAYLEVERVRFGDRLRLELDVPGELLSAHTPSFALQPLVENAVKYAVAPANRPVTVRVAARAEGGTLRLTVSDDGDPERAKAVRGGTGVGLAATRERLRGFYGGQARLETERRPDGFTAVLAMPLRRGPSGAASLREAA